MTPETLCPLFMWAFIFNFLFLLLWSGMFILAGDWMYGLHKRWFPMSREAFNIIHYAGIGLYKVLTIVFALIPWVALAIAG